MTTSDRKGIASEASEKLAWAEGEIRRLMDLNQSIFEALDMLGLGVVLVDGEHIMYATQGFLAICGYTLDEFMAVPSFYDVIPVEIRAAFRTRMAKRLRGEEVDSHYPVTMLHKDGHPIELDVAISLATVDGRPQVVAIVRPDPAYQAEIRAVIRGI